MSTHYVTRQVSPLSSDWVSWIDGGNSLSIDNDGIMPHTRIIIDLSHAMSRVLGRQMSMMSTYKLEYISINLVNVDDIDDNDSGAEFSGSIQWYTPTAHRINAMQLARAIEKHNETDIVDGDSWLLSNDKDYSGIRFNWDTDNQVAHATPEAIVGLSGSQWDIQELFANYAIMEGPPTQSNALWLGRHGRTDGMKFTTAYQNNMIDTDGINSTVYSPRSDQWTAENINAEVLSGLMVINVDNSNTTDPQTVDDDYHVEITIGVSGWRDF